MKKILTFIFLLLASLGLVACGQTDFPTVNESNKVELTQAELEQELDGVTLTGNILKVVLELDVDVEGEKLFAKGELYFSEEGAILELEANVNVEGTTIEGSGTAYLTDTGLYFNGGGQMTMGAMTNTIQRGKYLIESFDNEEDPVDFEGEFNLEDILAEIDLSLLLEDPTFIEMVAEYEGLTFYKQNNTFQVRLIVNNELMLAHPDIFTEDDLALNLEEDFELEAVVTFVDKKLTEFGIRMTGEGVKVLATATVVNTMPAFPTDLDQYKPFDLGF